MMLNSPPCSLDVFLEKTSWLINKGADLYRKHETRSAIQLLAHDVGTLLHFIDDRGDFSQQLRTLSETSLGLMSTILSDDARMIAAVPARPVAVPD